jgi:hypothetical protein
VLRIWIQDQVPFWPLDLGSGIGFFGISDPGFRIQGPYAYEPIDNWLVIEYWPTFFFFATSKTATKSRGEKKFISYLFYVATNFTKMYIILILKCWRKKFGNFQRILELLEVWVWDPRSGIRNKPIQDRGVKKAPDPGSGSATLILWNLWLYKKVWQVFNSSLSFVAVFGSGMRDPGPYTACMA